ncbi:hypothetical protein N7478_000273 [Penicillium angulare]|uniref:uncharacterized protein n=1 Tax=Penicillium angulare TaxID=116970 RepID=UPI00254095CA|nr:uncharacterized protein N7478_000273 [Penicillium angulare]KAJ5291022.1 hypothetical protein N7478_000273 [Penicillium angulare]
MSITEIEDDYNIQEAWNRACGAFAQTAKVDLTTSPKFTVDEVLDQIRTKQDEDDEKHNKFRVAKDVIGKTLKFITVLGGIAAQGASMVFAPSSLCFNAISYLISTGAKYKRIFSSLAELFRRVSDVLERCKIYMRLPPDAVDISLRKIINEELVCFVEICALSIRVLKGNKILTALKVFAFDSDEGVNGQLGRLALLAERESQMRATLGFESQKISERAVAETRDGTKKVTASVDKLLTFEKKRDADNATQRLLNSIDANLDMPSEAYKAVQAAYKRYLNEQVPMSGEWLKEDPTYTAWTRTEQQRCSILGISGAEGYGKSFLFAAMLKQLQDMYSESKDDLKYTSISYFIFDQDKKATSLIKALEVLAWQIAKADMVYRRDLGTIKTAGTNQIESLCEQLFGKSHKSDSTFFLLLDGIDQVDKQHLKEFIQVLGAWQAAAPSWSQFTLRVFLAGRTEAMNKINTELGDGISVIDVASKNKDDMTKFIKNRINKMEILNGASEQIYALRSEILETLTKETNGDFVNVGLLLDEISGKQRPGEIRDILSRSGEDRSDTIVRKIEYLNETLSDEDISDLNDLLTWVVHAARPLTLEELEAVLYLKSRESSLRPLAEKIRDQYSSLLHIAAARVYLISDSIATFLREKSDSENNNDSESLDDTGDISEGEVRIVRRFLESVCDPKLFKKFGFEDFFERKLKGKTARIGIDNETANFKIVSACLEVICSKDSPESDNLLEYAVSFFSEHLKLADPSLTHPGLKMVLGPQLVNTFAEDEIIDRWWSLASEWLRSEWIYQDENAEVTLKWLQDSAVTKNISETQRRWVKSLSSKSELDADILEHVGKALARRWLQSGLSGVAFMFDAVYGYVTKIENRKDPSIERSTRDSDMGEIQAAQIFHAAEWAQKQIELQTLGYEESRNLARTLRDYGQYDEAIEQFKHTATLSANNWFSQWGLADCHASKKGFTVAIEILEAAKRGIEAREIGNPDELEEELVEMERDLAEWNKEIGQSEKALGIYHKLLQDKPEDYDTVLELLKLLHKQGHRQGLLEFFESLKHSTDAWSGFSRRTQSIHAHYYRDEYHDALFASVANEEEFQIIFEGYEEAISAAKVTLAKGRKAGNAQQEWGAQICQIDLMNRLALLCQENSAQKPERTAYAIDQWLRILEINGTDDALIVERQAMVRTNLALVCFENASKNPDTATHYLKHLESIAASIHADDFGEWLHKMYPTRILARYHALQGEDTKVKDLLRGSIKMNLDLLSDDDPLNDWQGYRLLAINLMFAGQEADALAAWSLIGPNEDIDDEGAKDTGNSNESGTDRAEPEGPLADYCDGQCGTQWTYANNFHLCRNCNYVSFDSACLESLRNQTLKPKVCNKDHEVLFIPAYDPVERQRIGAGNVKVGEEVVSIAEWLGGIRKDWGIKEL